MTEIIPYLAGVVTMIFSFGFYLLIKEKGNK